MIWRNPEWFWALIVVGCVVGWRIFLVVTRRRPFLQVSSLADLADLPQSWRTRLSWLPFTLFVFAAVGFILALARPQFENVVVERKAEGIDIIMILDISTSMRAQDLKPDRFNAAKQVAVEFIEKRLSDRIGLVVFAGQSFTVCPPTLDYSLLKKLLAQIEMGVVEDGTAIGMGIATAINRLKDSQAKSRIIILLTDGENNAGEIDPVTAADLAVTYGIKIYAIGAGSRGLAPYPVQDPIFGKRTQQVRVDIDEEMMTSIAEKSGGKYYRATDTNSLRDIYAEIDKLERTKIDELIYTDFKELYMRFLWPAVLMLVLAMILEKTVFAMYQPRALV